MSCESVIYILLLLGIQFLELTLKPQVSRTCLGFFIGLDLTNPTEREHNTRSGARVCCVMRVSKRTKETYLIRQVSKCRVLFYKILLL